MKRETEGRGSSREQSPFVTGVLSLCVRLDMCAGCDTAGTPG